MLIRDINTEIAGAFSDGKIFDFTESYMVHKGDGIKEQVGDRKVAFYEYGHLWEATWGNNDESILIKTKFFDGLPIYEFIDNLRDKIYLMVEEGILVFAAWQKVNGWLELEITFDK